MNPELAWLEASASRLGLRLPSGAIERFQRYLDELLRWRERLNLTASATDAEIVRAHFTTSLIPLAAWPITEASSVIDVGSGAGFPGVPMKIARPDLRMVLVEASRRKVAFLEHVARALDLHDLEVAWARAEDLGRVEGFRETFSVAVERAVAKVAVSAELCLPLVRQGGVAILLKGPTVTSDAPRIAQLVLSLGGVIERAQPWTTDPSGRTTVAVVIRKTAPTPDGYPRRGLRLGGVA